MKEFYIITKSYDPGTASTNHQLSFIKAFDSFGIKAKWIIIFPNQKCEKYNGQFENITIKYLWNEKIGHNKYLRQIYKHYSYAKFYYNIREGDTVLLLGSKVYLRKLTQIKGVRVFHELTEHPSIGKLSRLPLFTTEMYLEWCKKVDGLFVITQALKDYFIKKGVNPEIVHVVNMVVDHTRFNNKVKQQLANPYIAYCGNASNTKDGVDDLIRAFAIVAKKHQQIRLKIIGPKPKEGTINYNLVYELHIEKRVDFVGIVTPSEMPQLLLDASIVALARPVSFQNTYGFPTKLGEYLLSSNPVCITEVGDIPLFLKHKENALLSECGNYKAFAANLIWCIEHPEEARIIGLRGKDVAVKNFNLLTEAKKILSVIFPDNFF